MVEFSSGVKDVALNLENDNIGVVLFGTDTHMYSDKMNTARSSTPAAVIDRIASLGCGLCWKVSMACLRASMLVLPSMRTAWQAFPSLACRPSSTTL